MHNPIIPCRTQNQYKNTVVFFTTIWYNYTIASAGTIVEPNATDDATNMNTTTESVCPKGWTLPTTKQINNNNKDASNFDPVLGGAYYDGTLNNEAALGYWWGSEAPDGASRYRLVYNGSSLYTTNRSRRGGFYVRCVSEEKTVTDLTYLQDMTGEIILYPPVAVEAIDWNKLMEPGRSGCSNHYDDECC